MPKNTLFDKFCLPPFSILDTRQSYWQKRKKQWCKWGGFGEDESRDSLVWDAEVSKKDGHQRICKVGTLLEFDPVLAEICYRWFCPSGGRILDPTCGGTIRGCVASYLGYKYLGIDLRQEQVEINQKKAQCLNVTPFYIVGDSREVLSNIKEKFDFVYSCPPYYDLEQYSEDPKDLSNKTSYDEFLIVYNEIIKKSCDLLKDNRFACFVVGDIRDKQGFYRNFVSDTIRCFLNAGLQLYNEIILMNVVGSVSLRVNKQFGIYRKVGKLHQNVLVFYKGNDCRRIKEDFEEIDQTVSSPTDQNSLF
jgi:hypothetical protein